MNSKVSSGSEILILRWDSDISHHYSGEAYGRVGNLTERTGSVQFCHMEESFPLVQFIISVLGTMMPRSLHREVQVAIFSVLWDNAISETSTGWQGCYFLMLLDTYSLSLCFSPNCFQQWQEKQQLECMRQTMNKEVLQILSSWVFPKTLWWWYSFISQITKWLFAMVIGNLQCHVDNNK